MLLWWYNDASNSVLYEVGHILEHLPQSVTSLKETVLTATH